MNNLADVNLRMTLTVLKDEHGEFFMMYSIRRDSIPNGVSDQEVIDHLRKNSSLKESRFEFV